MQLLKGRLWPLAVVGLCVCLMPSAVAQLEPPLQLSATAIGQAGTAAGKSFGLDIYITGITSDQQVQEYAATLRSKGQDRLVNALEKAGDVGRVAPVGSVGSGFRIVRIHPQKDGVAHIIMATNRPMSFGELYQGTRSRDYPIGIVTLTSTRTAMEQGCCMAPAKSSSTKRVSWKSSISGRSRSDWRTYAVKNN